MRDQSVSPAVLRLGVAGDNRRLGGHGLAYETPSGEELSERLASVLEVVYLIFNEGYTAARGEDWLRPQLCNEALRMGRVLTSIAPHEPEAHGLLALMELNASRGAARTDAAGEPILMLDQNRALWDQLQIRRGMQALGRARELGGAGGIYDRSLANYPAFYLVTDVDFALGDVAAGAGKDIQKWRVDH